MGRASGASVGLLNCRVVRLARVWACVALGLVVGGSIGCLVQLGNAMACGDGYVDRDAGEECDPLAPASYEDECEGTERPLGTASCDPDTCEIRNTVEDCRICGDDEVDPGEQCDGSVPAGETCVDGTAALECGQDCVLDYGKCPQCGNGKRDPPQEECDPFEGGGLAISVECSELPSNRPKPFTYGTASHCLRDCTYDRSGCSFCGDDEIDGPYNLGDVITLPEKCDGEEADPDALTTYCRKRCTGTVVGSLVFDCNYLCANNCLSFIDVPDDELECCVPPGETCPPPGSEFSCCWLLNNPGAPPEDACVDMLVGQEWRSVCK